MQGVLIGICMKPWVARIPMVSWVFAEPPLASKDYTHFSPRGALILAEIFYKALIQDYYEYKKKTAP